MKRCTKCILPETIPGISFNDEGLCNFCEDYKPIEYLGEEELLKEIYLAKSKNRKYDCIVPLSGGRDSSYVLFLASRKYGLNPLAVNYDNEFRSNQALINMKTACDILNVDFITLRSKRDLASRTVSTSIRNSAKVGLKSLATCFCDACAYGYHAVVYILAEKHNVPLILWGSSKMEYTGYLTDDYFTDNKTMLQKLINQPKVLRLKFLRLLHRMEFPVRGNLSRMLRFADPALMNKAIREIKIFDYIPWDQKIILETITSELAWRKPENATSTWRTDCELEKLVEYCFINIFGCSKRCLGYHNMINENQMTTEEAIELEEQTSPLFTDEVRLQLENMDLSEKDIERIRSFQNSLPADRMSDET